MTGDLSLIASSLFLWGFGEGLFFYFLPLSLQEFHASPILIGISLGGFGLFSVLTQIPSGYLSDRIGPKYILWTAWIVGALAALMMAFANSLWVFLAGLWIYYFTGFTVAPLNSLIVQVKGRLRVERAITLISGMYNLGAAAGPVIGGKIADRWGLSSVYKFASIFFVISTVIILFINKSQAPVHHHEKFRTNLLSNNRFMIFLGLVFLIVFTTYLPQPLTPNYLKNQALFSASTIGWLGTIANIGNTFFTLVLGFLKLNMGLLIGQLSVILFCFFLGQSRPTWLYAIGYFLLGGFRLTRNMLAASIRNFANDKELGFAFGVLETVTGLAVLSAPILAGFLYSKAPTAMYLVGLIGISLVVLLTLAFLLAKQKSKNSPQTGKNDQIT